MSIEEQRRKAFEAWYARQLEAEYERGDVVGLTFELSKESHWVTWNAALDSVVIELPNQLHAKPYACYEGGWNDALLETADLIEGMGLKVKP